MVVSRQLCITKDPYAYAEDEIDNYPIAAGYVIGSDTIEYQNWADHPTTDPFLVLRMNSHDEKVSRETIIEESTDQVAAASLFGGTYMTTGSFSGAFRPWDFGSSGLMDGIMGFQAPAAVARPGGTGGGTTGKRWELTMVPSTLAVKIVDEQAKTSSGTKGTTTIYRGVGITSAEITLAAKQYTTVNVQWMGRRAEVFATGYNSTNEPAGDPALFYNAVLKWTPEGGSAEAFKCSQFTMSVARPIDQDDFLIGSQFLANLSYNGLTDLGGSITLSASDWDKIRDTIAGSVSDDVYTLDQTRKEYFGEVTDATTTTVLANQIPSGSLEILLHTPNGDRVIGRIYATTCKLTEMSRSAQGRQKFNKTVSWKAQINNTDVFYVEAFDPANQLA